MCLTPGDYRRYGETLVVNPPILFLVLRYLLYNRG